MQPDPCKTCGEMPRSRRQNQEWWCVFHWCRDGLLTEFLGPRKATIATWNALQAVRRLSYAAS